MTKIDKLISVDVDYVALKWKEMVVGICGKKIYMDKERWGAAGN